MTLDRGLEGHLPSLELVAVTDRHVIGHVLYSEGRIGDTVVPGLAPLAVAPARQRMGIGSALVTRSLALAELAGHRLVVVTGRPAYYGRFGFVAASTFGIVPSNPEDFRDLHAFMVKPLGGRTTPRGTFTYAWQSHGLSLGGD